jgi:uncharacterized membrane protein YccC
MRHHAIARSPHDPERRDPAGLARRRRAVWADRITASDLGLGRLRLAVQTGLTLALVMWAEWLLVHYTHALQVPAARGALPAVIADKVANQHHAVIVIAMLLGCFITVASAAGIPNEEVRGQVIGFAAMAPAFVGGLAVALAVGSHRVPSLALMVVLLGLGSYAWRYGSLGLIGGVLVPSGFIIGYLLRGALTESGLRWVTAETGVALAACLTVRLTLFYPGGTRALRRLERSFAGCARLVADLATAALDTRGTGSAATRRRLDRLLTRLNQAALLLDARLAAGRGGRGPAAVQLHEALFEVELALASAARSAVSLGRSPLPPGTQSQVRQAVAALRQGDLGAAQAAGERLRRTGEELLTRATAESGGRAAQTGTSLRRLGTAVQALATAVPRWHDARIAGAPLAGAEPLSSPVRLAGGWLPGSAIVSAAASARPARHRPVRDNAASHRVTIQMTLASAAALIAGDALSGARFYWAVIAVPVILIGTYNVSEQASKAIFRVAGTLAGVLAGGLLVHAVGHRDGWAAAVVLVALTAGHYLLRVNYTFMIMGVTIAVSQLYEQLAQYSNHLLAVRLEETSTGAAAAALAVTLVAPLYTRRVLRVAAERHQMASAAVAGHIADRADGRGNDARLRRAARALDDAHQAVLATARPLRHLGLLIPPAARAARSIEPLEASYQDQRMLLADAMRR